MPVLAQLYETLPSAGPATKMFSRATRSNGTASRFEPQHPIRRRQDIRGPVLSPYHPPRHRNSNPTYRYRRPQVCCAERQTWMMLMRIRRYIHKRYKSLGLLRRDTYLTTGRSFHACAANCATKGWNARSWPTFSAGHTGQLKVVPRLRLVRNSAKDTMTRKPCGSPG